ncbi:MAG: PAS domain S-box protein [Methanocalculus sp. MSAO_Arc1]|uniref:PAS domain-containing protein n=1 Tax=Methanocalculus TaxID=71151 RepID=UPI000FF1F0D8|nr:MULTISPECIES: PAS domain S-box protein [unclassified Methanocalculus]MCP1661368.1 PAS domain S-box-containing protein [Methanocalculus sp. AMF5]RQD79660.1 MAG: PAS domain S-box protein [Methanocalculus sp. MSAO_Arc1]
MNEEREGNGTEFEMLKRTFHAIEDPIFFLDMDGIIRYANTASADLLQRPLDGIIGVHCHRVVHQTLTHIRGCPFVKAKQTKQRETYTVKLGDHWYQVAIDPVLTRDGEMTGAVHILTNIDTIKKNHELRAILGAIIETTHDPIIGETPDGRVISWNKGAEETFGYTAEEMVGESIITIIPEPLRDQWKKTLQKVQRGEPVQDIETRRITKDGRELELSLSLSPILDERGITTGIAVIGRNLTEIRTAERALVAYITEAALRLKNPVQIIAHTLEELSELHIRGEIDDEEFTSGIRIQARHAYQIVENIQELQQGIIHNMNDIPETYRKFLMDEE